MARRYAFKKVCLWVTVGNTLLISFSLLIMFYVKLPNQPLTAIDIRSTHYWILVLYSIVYQIVSYFFTLNQYYRLFDRKVPWTKLVFWTALFLSLIFVHYVIYNAVLKSTYYNFHWDISVKIFSYSFAAIFQLGVSLTIVAITYQLDGRKRQEEQQKILEAQKNQLEKEKMQADYQFLKAQVNPHFLHNTLNFLYARSLPYSTELSEGILTLSEIMRYSLNKQEDEEGKVLLTQEIEHLHNVIKIQQLRFGTDLQVVFDIKGAFEGLRIIPFVLITLVENAFKHGELKNPDCPIRLELCIDEHRQMVFKCSNQKRTGPKELSTGIGLDNTRKRLDLAYGENYFLYIRNQKDLFTVDLIITL
jgi:two-component system LytT family sensor kinase